MYKNITSIIKALLVASGVAYIFYDSLWGMLAGIPVGLYVYCMDQISLKRKRKQQLLGEFKNMLNGLQGALEAGKSMEQALSAARKEMINMYGAKNEIARELGIAEKKIALNMSMEKVLNEFGEHFNIREIYDFTEVITTINKTGGNAIRIIKDTVSRIMDEIELSAEIEVITAARRLEQNVMIFVPSGIILILRLGNGEFMKPLYSNVIGVIIMTFILGMNVVADRLGKKIVDFE